MDVSTGRPRGGMGSRPRSILMGCDRTCHCLTSSRTGRSRHPRPSPRVSAPDDCAAVTSAAHSTVCARPQPRTASRRDAEPSCSPCAPARCSATPPRVDSSASSCLGLARWTRWMSRRSHRDRFPGAGECGDIVSAQEAPGSEPGAGCRSSRPRTPGVSSLRRRRSVISSLRATRCFAGKGRSRLPGRLCAAVERHAGRRGHRALVTALEAVRSGTDSPEETRLRLDLVEFGLPEPVVNLPIMDEAGRLCAIGDTAYPEYLVLAEYDGEHHRTEDRQYARDADRLDDLTRLGWRNIRFTKRHRGRARTLAARAGSSGPDRSWLVADRSVMSHETSASFGDGSDLRDISEARAGRAGGRAAWAAGGGRGGRVGRAGRTGRVRRARAGGGPGRGPLGPGRAGARGGGGSGRGRGRSSRGSSAGCSSSIMTRGEAHAESAVRRHAVAEEVEVELELLGVEPLLPRLLDEHVDAVLALRAGGDLDAVEDEVVRVREVRRRSGWRMW